MLDRNTGLARTQDNRILHQMEMLGELDITVLPAVPTVENPFISIKLLHRSKQAVAHIEEPF